MTPTPRAPEAEGAFPSFRDPGGSLVEFEGRVLRVVGEDAAARLRTFLHSALHRELVAEGLLVPTRTPDDAHSLLARLSVDLSGRWSRGAVLFEHERVPFPSYPHEWPAELLWEAGRLTVELCQRTLTHGFGLKDATPYNVLFRGARPVFVDVLSFEPRDPADFVWPAYGQFVRTFLLPLAVWRFAGIPPSVVFLASRDGLTPEQASRWLGPVVRLRPPVFTLATIPSWLSRRAEQLGDQLYKTRQAADPDSARYVLQRLFQGLRRQLERLKPPAHRHSHWTGYEEEAARTAPEAWRAKHDWVVAMLQRLRPRTVLDVGCNTGSFAEAAATLGARVVAVDKDPVVVGVTWRRAAASGRDVLPLVVDLARPTPAVGWRNAECRSFLDRARGTFDAVLMLALVHHLAVAERVPVEEVAALAAELARQFVLVEFVPRDDPMFRRLVRGRGGLFEDWTPERFEAAFRRWFDVTSVAELPDSGRRLYCMVRRS
jgi:SAM-dependent methyltransferase